MKNSQNDKPKKSVKKKIFLFGLVSLAAGLVSYFGFQFWKKNRQENTETEKAPDPIKQSQAPKQKTGNGSEKIKRSTPKADTKSNTGKSAPNGSAKGQAAGSLAAAKIASDIHAAILKKDFSAAFNQLRFIRSVKDYSAVSQVFLKTPLAGKAQTLVSGLLSTFKAEAQKAALRKAFTAMGLKYDGKKWSLSGLDGGQVLITTQATQVWRDPKNFVYVPVNMVLGQEIAKRGDFSVFENEKRYFLVESKSVNYYTN